MNSEAPASPGMGQLAPVSVIIATRERPEMLSQCVESLLAGTATPAELVLVDQSRAPHPELSRIETRRGCRLIYRHSQAPGLSAARNEGCRAATQDILLFTDDDIVVAPEWVESMYRAIERERDTTVITGRVLAMREAGVDDGFVPPTSPEDELETRVFEGRIWRDMLWGGNMGLHRRILEEVGPFDERLGAGGRYFSAEDNDYCLRALEAGYRIRFLPEAVVHHRAWRPSTDRLRTAWRYGLGHGAFLAKHMRLRDRYAVHRLRSDLSWYARLGSKKRRSDPAGARDDGVLVLGMLYGAAKWMVAERILRRAP